jgi:hypothetical protein
MTHLLLIEILLGTALIFGSILFMVVNSYKKHEKIDKRLSNLHQELKADIEEYPSYIYAEIIRIVECLNDMKMHLNFQEKQKYLFKLSDIQKNFNMDTAGEVKCKLSLKTLFAELLDKKKSIT